MSDSILPQGLIQAYRETHYKTDDGLVLLIDQPNPALAQAQRERGTDCSAFITACNPLSQSLPADQNVARQDDLGAWAAERAPAAMAEQPVSPGIASSAQGPTLGSSALPSDPRFSPISLRRLLPPRLLATALEQRGLAFVSGIGQHPSNTWEGEASFIVYGLALADAKALGVHLQQNAIVWSAADGVPQLILLR